MNDLSGIGKMVLGAGYALVFFGLLLTVFGKIRWLGHLPGDIYIRKKDFTFYFPLATSILISVIVSLLYRVFFKK